ncbi:CaiB/BaiF CoA transferase family protein [Bradyrhizobium sp. SYSU BS000235]|uniref:CaiB/BaiF CoA transferase family protein n=1 Tax=Bradyrhizobium sp. SYSU BS000235 TaxID=3411332 RepID=UPI003C767B56
MVQRTRDPEQKATGPLSGLRILDLTTVLMGPFATSILGDMGADVIKVESPEGDVIRQVGPSRSGEMGGMFLHANRSKRSIVIDLKSESGRRALLRLAESSDVFVSNVRPQAMARLGLDYETLSAVNERIIYMSMVGYGSGGPYADRPAYDDLIQAAVGIPHLIGTSGGGSPRYIPINIADRMVGLHAASAILAAVLFRSKSGRGQHIEIPMFETLATVVLGDHMGGLTYDPPLDQGGYARLLSTQRRPFRTSDGYLAVLLYSNRHWRDFFTATGQHDVLNDERFASHAGRIQHADSLNERLASILLSRGTSEWCDLLTSLDVPHTRVHTLESLVDDAHLQAADFFAVADHPAEGRVRTLRVPSRWSESQPDPMRLAPRKGEHSREILQEGGYDADCIESLIREWQHGVAKEQQVNVGGEV